MPICIMYLAVLVLLIVVVVAAILVRLYLLAIDRGDAPARIGGFDDENSINYIPADQKIGPGALPLYASITDPRKLGSVKYYDRDIGQEVTIKSRLCYSPPSSDRQISTLFRGGDQYDRARLSILLSMVPGLDPFNSRTYKMRDSEIYRKIRPRSDGPASWRAKNHAIAIYRNIARTLHDLVPKSPAYLDIGCMDGSITAEIAALLGATDVHCVEPSPRGSTPGVEMTREVGRYPYLDGKFDIITCIMSLHHIPNLEQVVPEILRVLKPGGYIFIKDHDLWTPADCALTDIEHAIHMTFSGELAPGALLSDDYYIQYRNFHAFDELFAGTKYIKSNHYYPAARYNVAPTRSYWVIYQKPTA